MKIEPYQVESEFSVIATWYACETFSKLYRQKYFRLRHRQHMAPVYYHIDLPELTAIKEWEEFYTESAIKELRDKLSKVDRRAFYKHVVNEIAPDGSVCDIRRWVAQNIAGCQQAPSYDRSDPNQTVKDGIEILFIGFGKCGQTNRLLGFLLKYGLGEDVKLVQTPGHGFIEWKPKGEKPRILDADWFRDGNMGDISVDDLDRERLLDGDTPTRSVRFGAVKNYRPIKAVSAYVTAKKGPSWYAHNDLDLSEDGTRILEDVATHAIDEQKVNYDSPGRETFLVSKAWPDSKSTILVLGKSVFYAESWVHLWVVKKPERGYYLPEELATNLWIRGVVASGTVAAGNPSIWGVGYHNKISFTEKLHVSSESLTNNDYCIIIATGRHSLWGFHIAYGPNDCSTFF